MKKLALVVVCDIIAFILLWLGFNAHALLSSIRSMINVLSTECHTVPTVFMIIVLVLVTILVWLIASHRHSKKLSLEEELDEEE